MTRAHAPRRPRRSFGKILLPLIFLVWLSACITDMDAVTVTGLFEDPEGQVPVDDLTHVSGIVYVGYSLQFRGFPACCPDPTTEVGAYAIITNDQGETSLSSLTIDANSLPNGFYRLKIHVFPTGVSTFAERDSDNEIQFVVNNVPGTEPSDFPRRRTGKVQPPFRTPFFRGDDIAMNSGEFIYAEKDLSILSRGMPFVFERTYRSQLLFDSPMGFGWDHRYNQRLYTLGTGNILFSNGEGLLIDFTEAGANTFTAPAGIYATLTKEQDGTFTMRERLGARRRFNADGRLTALENRAGHRIACEYNSSAQLVRIRDTIGRAITLAYTASGKIASMEDFTGRKVSYDYDADHNLIACTLPASAAFPSGRTTRYAYTPGLADNDENHNLISITDPKGQTFLENTFDGQDRVAQQRFAGGTFHFDYQPGKTHVTLRDGSREELTFDAAGHVTEHKQLSRGLRPTDPASYTTTYTHNAHGEVTRIVWPRGNETVIRYDEPSSNRLAQGNVLEIRRRAGSTGTAADLVTTYAYEDRFQQVKTIIDPRGNDPALGPPARFQTTFFYDYEEGPSFTAQDFNQDGRTDQAKGNLIRIDYPQTRVVNAAGAVTATNSSRLLLVYDDQSQLTRQVLPNGTTQAIEYFPASGTTGDPTSREGYVRRIVADPAGIAATRTFEMTALGLPVTVTDANGHSWAMQYSPSDQLMRQVSPTPFLYERTYQYDENDDLTQLLIQNVKSDENGQLTADPALPQISMSYTYNQARKLTSASQSLSATRTATIQLRYDDSDRLQRVTSALGNKTDFVMDERELPVSITRGAETPDAATTRYTFTLNGQVGTITNPRGNTSEIRYDPFDRAIELIDPLGARVATTFDPVGNAVRRTIYDFAARGGQVLLESFTDFDEASRAIRSRTPIVIGSVASGEAITVLERDAAGRPTRTFNANGHPTSFSWDALDRLTGTQDALGNQMLREFDAVGNVTGVTSRELDPRTGRVDLFTSRFAYDELNRMTASVDNAGQMRRLAYDSRSHVVVASDANGLVTGGTNGIGNIVRQVFDGGGRRVQTMSELRAGGRGNGSLEKQIRTTFAFDDDHRLVAMIDDNGSPTAYSHDALGRLRQTRYADGSSEALVRDFNGNVTQFTQRDGTVISNVFDAADRVTSRQIARAAGIEGSTFEHFSYDGLGRALQMENDASTIERRFDSLGRLIRELQNGRAIVSAFNAGGNRTSLIYPGGRRLVSRHDALERLTQITDSLDATPLASFAYAGPSRLSNRTYQNGTTLDVGYDVVARPETLVHRRIRGSDNRDLNPPVVFDGFQYVFDREGNQLAEIRLASSKKAASGYDSSTGSLYAYDSAYRVTQAKTGVRQPLIELVNPGTTDKTLQTDFRLDGLANWTSVTQNIIRPSGDDDDGDDAPGMQPGQQVVTRYSYSPLNQVVQAVRTRQKREFTESFNYNRKGDRVSDGSFTYVHDYRGQTVRAEEVTAKVHHRVLEFSYDVLGRRIRREARTVKVKTGSNSKSSDDDEDDDDSRSATPAVTLFFYDGNHLIEEQDPLGRTLRTYVHQQSRGPPLSMDVPPPPSSSSRNAGRYFYHESLLGSVSHVTDEKGHVAESYRYTTYGTPSLKPGDRRSCDFEGFQRHGFRSKIGNPYLFGGQRFEEELGLYDLRFRDYDPDVGQFLSADPLGAIAGPNSYAYVGSNPVNFTDPLGLSRMSDMMKLRQEHWNAAQSTGLKKLLNTLQYTLDALDYLSDNPDLLLAGFVDAWGTPDIAANLRNAAKKATVMLAGVAAGLVVTGLTGNPVLGDLAAVAASRWAADQLGFVTTTSFTEDAVTAVVVGAVFRGLFASGNTPPPSKSPPPPRGPPVGGGGSSGGGGGNLPELIIDANRNPALAENIWHAQQAGHPSVLTHGGQAASDINRPMALQALDDAGVSWRPLSPDEYPFASSAEGGSGAWLGPIPRQQQSSQGGLISTFVQNNGIRVGDQYRVTVINYTPPPGTPVH